MKKIPCLFILIFLLAGNGASAYTNTDISSAEYLANENLIVKQSSASAYRLDDTITRAEVIGIALKMKGVTLPDDYFCKNYFSDVKYDIKNNWICRAMEIASDNGLITRSNKKARPNDKITRAEALAILIRAGDIPLYDGKMETQENYFDTNDWQKRVILTAGNLELFNAGEISNIGYVCDKAPEGLSAGGYCMDIIFNPNQFASRKSIFGFTENIYKKYSDKGKTLRKEKGNIVLYESGKKVLNVTQNGTDTTYGCKNTGDVINSYNILQLTQNYGYISYTISYCDLTVGGDDITPKERKLDLLIYNFEKNSTNSFRDLIKNKFDIELSDNTLIYFHDEEEGLIVRDYLRNTEICDEDIDCHASYISDENIQELNINAHKATEQGLGGFEWKIQPKDLF